LAAQIVAVSLSARHDFSKQTVASARLLEGLGVEGDCHLGRTVQHRSRVASDPAQPNLRQVHLIGEELLFELKSQGFEVGPGALGENVTTRGVDLLSLPRGARLQLGAEAEIELTGLRNPCRQIDDFRPGLLAQVLGRAPDGGLIRKAGVMAVVVRSGLIRPGDPIHITLPPEPHQRLDHV
jgi:MOSC domain-containing protein YiiM